MLPQEDDAIMTPQARRCMIFDLVLVVVFFILFYIYMLTSWQEKSRDIRLIRIPETAPRACAYAFSKLSTEDKVSIVVIYRNFQFYDMKITLKSILLNTESMNIQEIIVVDFDSSQNFTQAHLRSELTYDVPGIRWLKLLDKGPAEAMMGGFQESRSPIVVYLQPGVVVNKGWLPPLVHVLKERPSAVVAPHLDTLTQLVTLDYHQTSARLRPVFTWSLAIRMTIVEEAGPPGVKPVPTSVLYGSAFAVNKKFLEEVGWLDTEFQDRQGGGEILEFSFRVWRCGGELLQAPCSRVGVPNLNEPVKVTSHANARRLVEMWLYSKKDAIFRNMGVNVAVARDERQQPSRGLEFHKRHFKCKGDSWYLNEVARHELKLRDNVVKIGLLHVQTGSCARPLDGDKAKVMLDSCADVMQHRKYVFQLLKTGQLVVTDRCLAVTHHLYVELRACKAEDENQRWDYTDAKELRHRQRKFCAMHVTDPDSRQNKRQLMMVSPCETDTDGAFKTWRFISI